MENTSELVPAASGRSAPAVPPRRERNARGQGARLTEDIVTGALALIERSGSDEAVTLRAVAREIGISAPSIYAHFADREAIVMAVVLRVFGELAEAIEQGTALAGQDPVARLVAGCGAYVSFGLAHPARYGVLFSTHSRPPEEYCAPVPLGPDGRPVMEFGAEAFALLVRGIEDCVTAGSSASTDVVGDATAVWVALHGAVTLRTTLPGFPWPEPEPFVRHLVLSLARITGTLA
ncbi:MAG TPA: TetR/AcrR family transcriptional regulator [Streptosporangiaceae bacterium]|nr:TetR/AcrR family transcriptional regulator [Streptosporangiaceae bacterium]